MDFRILVGNRLQQLSVAVVNQHTGLTLGADVEKAGFVGGDTAVSSAERCSCRQLPPVRNHLVGPFAIAGL